MDVGYIKMDFQLARRKVPSFAAETAIFAAENTRKLTCANESLNSSSIVYTCKTFQIKIINLTAYYTVYALKN